MSETGNLANVKPADLTDERARTILLGGLGSTISGCTAEEACGEWERRSAIPFDLETGITVEVTATFGIWVIPS